MGLRAFATAGWNEAEVTTLEALSGQPKEIRARATKAAARVSTLVALAAVVSSPSAAGPEMSWQRRKDVGFMAGSQKRVRSSA